LAQNWGYEADAVETAKGKNQIQQECTGKPVHSLFLLRAVYG